MTDSFLVDPSWSLGDGGLNATAELAPDIPSSTPVVVIPEPNPNWVARLMALMALGCTANQTSNGADTQSAEPSVTFSGTRVKREDVDLSNAKVVDSADFLSKLADMPSYDPGADCAEVKADLIDKGYEILAVGESSLKVRVPDTALQLTYELAGGACR